LGVEVEEGGSAEEGEGGKDVDEALYHLVARTRWRDFDHRISGRSRTWLGGFWPQSEQSGGLVGGLKSRGESFRSFVNGDWLAGHL
jgi:hypothetical protein